MGHLGLEPRTIRLKAEYSTIELVTRDIYFKQYKIRSIFLRNFLLNVFEPKKVYTIILNNTTVEVIYQGFFPRTFTITVITLYEKIFSNKLLLRMFHFIT